jgi:hypothetical protein
MVNTVTQRTLLGAGNDRNIVRMIHIVSDGTEESDLVIYDNSAFINDASKGRLEYVYVMGSDGTLRLEWDQTTDSPAISINSIAGNYVDFRQFGGIPNPNGSGATGDLLLSTAALDSGDEVTLIIGIAQG